MKVSYNWLQEYFEEALPSVSEIEQVFMMHAFEVDGVEEVEIGEGNQKKIDWIIDLDVLPNRAHDALGHRGIAKELSVLLDREMKKDELGSEASKTELLGHPVSNLLKAVDVDEEWCPRFTGALVTGVVVKESPDWLKEKLEVMGQKSINNVVDITNYVMFGIGQPAHVWDADKLKNENGDIEVGVRKAEDGEKITILGGEEFEIDESIGVVINAHTDEPIGLAGVKGGALAEVDESTVNIVVESSKWHPIMTRRASAKLKIRTDAVQRFENEVAIQQPILGTMEVARLIVEVAGGELEGYVDTNPEADKSKNECVTIELAGLNAFLGSVITINEAEEILKRFGWEHSIDSESIMVIPPFERLDVNIPEDVYEEIGRVHGFGTIVGEPLPADAPPKFINKERVYSELVRKVMLSLDIVETMTYTLTDKGDIKLASILNNDKDHVRANLSDAIVNALDKAEKNAPLLGEYKTVKTFEIGRVFTQAEKNEDGEWTSVAVGVRALGKKKREQKQDDFLTEAKSALEAELGTELSDLVIRDGVLEFNLTKTFAELPIPDAYPELPLIDKDVVFSPMSSYPFMTRDIAMWAPEGVDEAVITGVIGKHGGELVVRIDKFDEFAKGGRVSLAFHIIFQSMEKTLTDDEVGDIMKKIETELGGMEGFEVR